jgi:type II secretory pathway component GspD/PulD (secretin)
MNVLSDAVTRRVSKSVSVFAAVALAFALVRIAAAQTDPPVKDEQPKAAESRAPEVRQTFFLTNVTEQNDLNDIQTDLRNMLPRARVYGVASQYAISVAGSADEVRLAQGMISELDRPRKLYRLTYTFTDLDNGKRGEPQQYAIVAIQGERTDLKQGTKVPIVTGTNSKDSPSSDTQIQYLDIGLHISATVSKVGLHSHIERSSLSEEKASVGAQDPIVRQTVLDEATLLPLGKPIVLGTLDIPGATHRQEVAVTAEALP